MCPTDSIVIVRDVTLVLQLNERLSYRLQILHKGRVFTGEGESARVEEALRGFSHQSAIKHASKGIPRTISAPIERRFADQQMKRA